MFEYLKKEPEYIRTTEAVNTKMVFAKFEKKHFG